MFVPSDEILKKYADLLVKFALGSGEGVKRGEVVMVTIPECAKPFYLPLQKAIFECGAFPFMRYLADGVSRSFIDDIPDELVDFFPKEYMLSRVDMMDHRIAIIADADKHAMEGVDMKKMFKRSSATKFYREALSKKENEGNHTWTIALYGTKAMADEVGMSEEAYWDQIITACYLNEEDPIQEWREIEKNINFIKNYLNDLKIAKVHMVGEDCDLTVKLGTDRSWLGGSGRNIPSYELFISPDWRGTQGWIRFNQPLYRYGGLVEGVELYFEDGKVVKSSATKNEAMLKEMIAQENADKVGEYSLTDCRISRITKLMGETLYDENRGGKFGNSHIALGNAYKDSFPGDESVITKEQRKEMGYNESTVHTDIITTVDRTVTATTVEGEEIVIYKDGKFTFWNDEK